MDDPVSPRLARMRAEVMNQLPNRSFVVTKATQDAVIAEENRKAVDDGRAAEPKPPSFKVSTPLPDSATVLEQLAALQDNVMRHAKHSKASLTRQHSKNLSHSFVSSADPLVSAPLPEGPYSSPIHMSFHSVLSESPTVPGGPICAALGLIGCIVVSAGTVGLGLWLGLEQRCK